MGYLALSSPRIYRLVTRVLSGKLISHKKNRPLVCAFVNLFIYVFFFFHKIVICVKHYTPAYWETRYETGQYKARTAGQGL